MKIKGPFAYSVLSEDSQDYVKSSTFHVEGDILNQSFKNGELSFTLTFQLSDKYLEGLISNGYAMYAVHIECPQTCERQTFLTNEKTIFVSIKEGTILKKFEINAAVILIKDLENFTSESWSEFYKGTSYKLRKGNILAFQFLGTYFALEVEEASHSKSIIQTSFYHGQNTNVVLHQDYIMAALPQKEWRMYERYGTSFEKTNNAQLNLPILIEAFSAISHDASQYEDYRWFAVLSAALQTTKYTMEDVVSGQLSPMKAAELVLNRPLWFALKEQETFLEGER